MLIIHYIFIIDNKRSREETKENSQDIFIYQTQDILNIR